MEDDKYKNYLWDLIFILKEKALEAKKSVDESNQDDYNSGYLMAFYEIIDLMKHQADAFTIKQDDIGLADIDADRDLL